MARSAKAAVLSSPAIRESLSAGLQRPQLEDNQLVENAERSASRAKLSTKTLPRFSLREPRGRAGGGEAPPCHCKIPNLQSFLSLNTPKPPLLKPPEALLQPLLGCLQPPLQVSLQALCCALPRPPGFSEDGFLEPEVPAPPAEVRPRVTQKLQGQCYVHVLSGISHCMAGSDVLKCGRKITVNMRPLGPDEQQISVCQQCSAAV